MERSSFTLDLGAIRRNAATLLRAAGGAELWAVVKANGYGHGASRRRPRCATPGRVGSLRRDGGGSARAASSTRSRRGAHHRHGPTPNAEVAGPRTLGSAGARPGRRTASRGCPAAPEDRHGHGPLGPLRASRSDEERRRRHEPSRRRRGRIADFTNLQIERFREATADLSGTLVRHLANSAGTLRYPGRVVRRGALRHRAVRHLPLRERPGAGRARARASLGVVRRAGEAARARRQHRLRTSLRGRRADLDRRRSGGLRGRLPP